MPFLRTASRCLSLPVDTQSTCAAPPQQDSQNDLSPESSVAVPTHHLACDAPPPAAAPPRPGPKALKEARILSNLFSFLFASCSLRRAHISTLAQRAVPSIPRPHSSRGQLASPSQAQCHPHTRTHR